MMASIFYFFCTFLVLPFVKSEVNVQNDTLMGLYAPVFTPFDKNGNLNVSVIDTYAQWLKESGMNGVIINGLLSEGEFCTTEELNQLVDAWTDAAKPIGLKVVVDLSYQAYQDKLQMAYYAEDSHVEAITTLVDISYFTEDVDLWVYYLQPIAAKAPDTAFMFNAVDICSKERRVNLVELFEKATCRIPNFVGFFCSIETALQITANVELREYQRLIIYSSMETMSAFEYGFSGSVTCMASLWPDLVLDIYDVVTQNDTEEARNIQFKLNRRYADITAPDSECSPDTTSNLKAVMNLVNRINGIDVGPVRRPLPVTGTARQKEIARKLYEDDTPVEDIEE